MHESLIVVDGFRSTQRDHTNLRREKDVLEFALDQRAFGPRRLLVAFARRSGKLISVAHAPRCDPPEGALDACIRHLGRGAAMAVAYADEPVADGPPPDDLAERFARARAVASALGVHLADWIACDDQLFRSTALALGVPPRKWLAVPKHTARQ